ncbi:MAG TPA: hypothetical protein VMG12_16025 [Polyangiaceae bacterium]|nr:hypothetical protein [Polyangiaceae bacterium]
MKTSNAKVLRGLIAAGSLLWAIGSCGRAADEEELQIDSNTNWLMRCTSDDQCSGSLRCYCGQCSQPCADNDECSLLAGAECASTGGAVCGEQPALGGLCVLGCRLDVDCGPDFGCIDNQCVAKPCTSRLQSWDELLTMIAQDINRLDAADAPLMRYLSIGNHALNAACGESPTRERHAMNRLLNSLSSETTVEQATQVDDDGTLYRINLRDYGWNRPITVGGRDFIDAWEALVANNPLALQFVGDEANDIAARMGASVPVMFVDSLIAVGTRPDVYAAVLGVPNDYSVLLAELGIDRTQPTSPFRAGFISRTEIVASHWDTRVRTGYVWEIADVGRDDGALFADPLLDPAGERAVIYTLPNGFQAFAYMANDGGWLDDSSTFIDASANNFRATAPLSMLREHSPMVNVREEVLSSVRANPDRYTPEVLGEIYREYIEPGALAELLQRESDTFVTNAIVASGGSATEPEPITATFDAYDRDVTLEVAAGDLMVSPQELRDNLYLLDPAIQVLDAGRLDRGDFEFFYRDSMCTLAVINDNAPADCP